MWAAGLFHSFRFVLVFVVLLSQGSIHWGQAENGRDETEVLYATNALAVDECTLHRLDPDSGHAVADVGKVQTVSGENVCIFGMCVKRGSGTIYAITHRDQLVRLDADTAIVTAVGDDVGVNGLYDLACHPENDLLYSFCAVSNQIVVINGTTGRGTLLPASLPSADAVSMDFPWSLDDELESRDALWLLLDGTRLSKIDIQSGEQIWSTILSGGSLHINQRHGSIRKPSSTSGNLMYSAFFESDPSSIWRVSVEEAVVVDSVSTGLVATYALAFGYSTSSNKGSLPKDYE